nr:ferritin-like domain-containing protein [Pirellulales bacterium]
NDFSPIDTINNVDSPESQAEQTVGRRGFLRGGAIAAGGVALAACLNEEAQAAPAGPRQQFALIRRHENDHVNFLVGALGPMARPRPNFQNLQRPNLNDFLTVTLALENTGSGAYLGAAPAIFDPMVLANAGSIAFVEARHIGYLNGLRSKPMTENLFGQELSFERALTISEVVASAGPFIANLNGGPPLTFDPNPANASPANDIAILNFALALEYLERDFYNINVPIFYGV